MTLRPLPTLAAATALALLALSAPCLQADPLSPSSAPPASSPVDSAEGPLVSTQAPIPSIQTVRYYHRSAPRYYTRRALRAPSLPSRGITEPLASADTAVGRLGIVTAAQAQIVAGRDRAGRVLSLCPKGQYLAISGETPTHYAVLMIDHSLGYIAKTDVQLLDYQVAPAAGAAGDTTPAASDASALGLRMVQVAQTYLGVPYVWGGVTRKGIDCSGFVQAIYSACGIQLPRVSRDQATVGYDVPHDVAAGDWKQWVPGDRLYFACHHPYIDHTAMYIGDGYFIQSSAGHSDQVAIDPVTNPYYSSHLVAVRRSIQLVGDPPATDDTSMTASNDSESDQQ